MARTFSDTQIKKICGSAESLVTFELFYLTETKVQCQLFSVFLMTRQQEYVKRTVLQTFLLLPTSVAQHHNGNYKHTTSTASSV